MFEVYERGRLFIQGEEDDSYDENISNDGAYLFWSRDDLDPSEFGIVVVEGDAPGSSYFAAKLQESTEFANAAAERLGVAIRFI